MPFPSRKGFSSAICFPALVHTEVEEAGADWRMVQTCGCSGPGLMPSWLLHAWRPAQGCLSFGRSYPPPAGSQPALQLQHIPLQAFRGRQRPGRGHHGQSFPYLKAMLGPQVLGMFGSLESQGSGEYQDDAEIIFLFPSPSRLGAAWYCREHRLTWYFTRSVLISDLILACCVSSDRSLPLCLTHPLCRVVEPFWLFSQSALRGNVQGQLRNACCCYFCWSWRRVAILIDTIRNV